jgi:hypothetical protein
LIPNVCGFSHLGRVAVVGRTDEWHVDLRKSFLANGESTLTLAAGETLLTFTAAEPSDGQPFYHFAFNIPENRIESACCWQTKRTPLLPIPARLRDPEHSNDVVNYAHWNAHSIFFFDPAGNVVECIARHDLRNAASGDFGSSDILYASEIAFVTDDVPALTDELKRIANTPLFRRGGDENFMALGGEDDLLLIMKRGRVISFDAPDKKSVDVFGTAIKVRGLKMAARSVGSHPFDVAVETS